MKQLTWKNICCTLLFALPIYLITIWSIYCFKDKEIKRYVLENTSDQTAGIHYVIKEECIWGKDRYILLKTDVTLDRTLQIIDSLNLKLKNN